MDPTIRDESLAEGEMSQFHVFGIICPNGNSTSSGDDISLELEHRGRVPGSGIQYLGQRVPTSSVPIAFPYATTLAGVHLSVDRLDPARDYTLRITVGGILVQSLLLASGLTEASAISYNDAIDVGEAVTLYLERTSGNGRSTFRFIKLQVIFRTA